LNFIKAASRAKFSEAASPLDSWGYVGRSLVKLAETVNDDARSFSQVRSVNLVVFEVR
jgi:hypothetical protein